MASGTAYNIIRVLFIICNFIGILTGIAMIAVAAYLYVEKEDFLDLMPKYEDVNITAVMMAGGIIILVVAFIGFCGAWMESQCMLIVFFTAVCIIFVLEVAVGIVGFIYRGDIDDEIEMQLKDGLEEEKRWPTWDVIQKEFRCCGVINATDWYNALDNAVPDSCCSYEGCGQRPQLAFGAPGCYQKVKDELEDNFYALGAAGLALGILQIILLTMTMVMICAIRRKSSLCCDSLDTPSINKSCQYAYIIFNVAATCFGLTMAAVGIYMLAGEEGHKFLAVLPPDLQPLRHLRPVLIVVGLLAVLVTKTGICGMSRADCILTWYVVMLAVVAIANSVIVFLVGSSMKAVKTNLAWKLVETLKNSRLWGSWFRVQEIYKCCGVTSKEDWVTIRNSSALPVSCCWLSDDSCNTTDYHVHEEACLPYVDDYLRSLVATIGVVSTALLCLLLALLACTVFLLLRDRRKAPGHAYQYPHYQRRSAGLRAFFREVGSAYSLTDGPGTSRGYTPTGNQGTRRGCSPDGSQGTSMEQEYSVTGSPGTSRGNSLTGSPGTSTAKSPGGQGTGTGRGFQGPCLPPRDSNVLNSSTPMIRIVGKAQRVITISSPRPLPQSPPPYSQRSKSPRPNSPRCQPSRAPLASPEDSGDGEEPRPSPPQTPAIDFGKKYVNSPIAVKVLPSPSDTTLSLSESDDENKSPSANISASQ